MKRVLKMVSIGFDPVTGGRWNIYVHYVNDKATLLVNNSDFLSIVFMYLMQAIVIVLTSRQSAN